MTGWGFNALGQISIPAGLSNVIAIAAGYEHNLTLKSDGTVVAFGSSNSDGQTSVPPTLTNVVAIAAGAWHSLALKSDGTVVGWGNNWYGQSKSPTDLSNVVAIAAGQYFSLALKSDVTLVAWGLNGSGETNVPTGLNDVIAIAAGWYHGLAVKHDGRVVAWGESSAQTVVPTNLTEVVAIDGGRYHTLALKSDGTVTAWGQNGYGQTNVPAGLNDVVAVVAGGYHSLALRTDGTVVAWGYNDYGQANVPLGLTKVTGIAGGTDHSLALTNDGSPRLLRQARNQMTYSGSTVTMSAAGVGSPPLHYQWQLDGTNISSATNAFVVLNSAQLVNAGTYRVVVTNSYGSVVSSDATLTVVTSLPLINVQPTNQAILLGSNASFGVTVVGSLPLTYQWRLNETDILGATNSTLNLTNVQILAQGRYDVVVSNSFGTVTSSNALLRVEDLADLGSVLGTPNLIWTNVGNPPWITQTAVTHDGVAAARSGAIATNQQSILQTIVVGPSTLKFWWKVSSRGIFHPLALVLNGVEQTRISGEVDWQQKTIYLGGGANTLQWVYSKNSFSAMSQDAAWLDEVNIQLGATPAAIATNITDQTVLAGTDVTFRIATYGTPQLLYQWQFNRANIAGATNSSLLLPNVQASKHGAYGVVVSNAYGSVFSSNSILTVIPSSPFAISLQPLTQYVVLGSNTTFSATARGSEPLTYRWQFNSNDIAVTFSSSLTLMNVQSSNAGSYRVVVTNAYGNANSVNTTLNVVNPTALAESLDALNLSWFTGGSAPWIGQTNTTHDGVDTARSGPIGANQQSILQATVVGPGTLGFWWRVSSRSTFHPLTFSDNGATRATISGEVGWQQRTFFVDSGTSVLQWSFSKDSSSPAGQDGGWVDQVSFTPYRFDLSSTHLQMQSNGFMLTLSGVFATNMVVIYASTNLVNWSPVFTNPPTIGSLQFLDEAATNLPLRFYRAEER